MLGQETPGKGVAVTIPDLFGPVVVGVAQFKHDDKGVIATITFAPDEVGKAASTVFGMGLHSISIDNDRPIIKEK